MLPNPTTERYIPPISDSRSSPRSFLFYVLRFRGSLRPRNLVHEFRRQLPAVLCARSRPRRVIEVPETVHQYLRPHFVGRIRRFFLDHTSQFLGYFPLVKPLAPQRIPNPHALPPPLPLLACLGVLGFYVGVLRRERGA